MHPIKVFIFLKDISWPQDFWLLAKSKYKVHIHLTTNFDE